MEVFKGDATELKFIEAGSGATDVVSTEKDTFYSGAYEAEAFGDILYDLKLTPLSYSIPKENYRDVFWVIFNQFPLTGTFEVFLSAFRAVFGPDVDVTFTVPAPGKLTIDIAATGLILSDFIAREIIDNVYVTNEIIDDVGDNIAFLSLKGFANQSQVERMLFEMVVAGIYVTVTLDLG
jgi:hypothetical protein